VNGVSARAEHLNYKLIAAGLVVAYTAYSAATKAFGDALFSTVIATLLFLNEAKLSPGSIIDRAKDFFQSSDRIARRLVIALAIGGSALAIDVVYGLDFLPDWLDVWVKRTSPAFIFISINLIVASVVSKRVYSMSTIEKDRLVRFYEISYYLLVISSSVIILSLCLGLPIEEIIPSSREYSQNVLIWPNSAIKAHGVLATLSIIWMIGMVTCILSRYFEWAWKIDASRNSLEESSHERDNAKNLSPGSLRLQAGNAPGE
jgi:hypothetical protein